MRKRGPAQIERSAEIHREVVRPVVVGHGLGPAHPVASCDVDQHIEAAELRDAALDRSATRRRRTDVQRRVCTRFHFGENLGETVGVPCDAENRCTLAAKQAHKIGRRGQMKHR
jgi:hypothetical protein